MFMRESQLTKDEKKLLVQFLERLNILPIRQGRIVINISPDRSISTIEVTSFYQ
jgi:hypothetical protein